MNHVSQDTIWSPTLYEFSTMAAIEGKEGMYLAITMAPMYLAALPVGLISGGRSACSEGGEMVNMVNMVIAW